jgi:prepilin-type N-terminal cleavage/methylation domain-containing protein
MSRTLRIGAARACDDEGFSLIEVLVATVILVTGLLALFGMLDIAARSTATNRVRQEGTSVAREVLEDARTLAYTQLTSGTIASSLQPVVSNSSVSGSNLLITRQINGNQGYSTFTFKASFSVCSLDDPSDGYGNHSSPPASGGTWCPDVAASGTADSTPDDYKRVSVTVAPTGTRTTPTVQQTVLIYAEDTHGPAVSCLTTISGTCPGTNQTITTNLSSATFYVTTTQAADKVQWLVNGNPPPSNQIASGQQDPYSPDGTTSQFTWVFPTVVAGGKTQTIDGTYTIKAVAYDANGHSGTSSTLQITVNEHDAIPPGSVTAGWNNQLSQGANGGGVDVQWTPSVDQDILYYDVYRKLGSGVTQLVCQQVSGTSCTDLTASSPNPPATPTCSTFPGQSYTTPDNYTVVGVDTNSATGQPRISTQVSSPSDANLCDHPPNAPTSLSGSAVSGTVQLSWTAPSPQDPDLGDSIQAWRVYRWQTGGNPLFPGSRLNLVGTAGSTSFTDLSPDPGGATQSYCVTAVDRHLNESACSPVVSG